VRANAVAFTHFLYLSIPVTQLCVVDTDILVLVPADVTLDPFNPMSPVRIVEVRMKNGKEVNSFEFSNSRYRIQRTKKAVWGEV
jgi:hypothetical protein